MLRHVTTCSLALAVTLFGIKAQDADAQPAPDHNAALTKACAHMQSLTGLSWSSFESQDSAMMRRFRRAMPGQGETEVEGKEGDGILQVSLNFEEDRLLLANGRMIASFDEGPWLLRRSTLANGGKVPYLYDSQRFFEVFAAIPAAQRTVTKTETATYRKKAVVIYSVTLSEETAGSFGLTGAIPSISGGGMIMIGLNGGGGGSQEMPVATTDLAFYVDSETQEILRVKAKTYKESKTSNMQIQIQGAGNAGDDEEEEEVKEFSEDGKRIYKLGMPVRAIDSDTSAMEFDVRFKEHGKPFMPKISSSEKKMLKLTRGR